MFIDIVGASEVSNYLSPAAYKDFVLQFQRMFAEICRDHFAPTLAAVAPEDRLFSARGDEGSTVHALARRGVAVGDTEVLTLTGAVRVTATPAPSTAARQGLPSQAPARLMGEGLTIDGRGRVVSADQPTTLVQGNSIVRGNTMRHDQTTGITEFRGRVSGRYDPAGRP